MFVSRINRTAYQLLFILLLAGVCVMILCLCMSAFKLGTFDSLLGGMGNLLLGITGFIGLLYTANSYFDEKRKSGIDRNERVHAKQVSNLQCMLDHFESTKTTMEYTFPDIEDSGELKYQTLRGEDALSKVIISFQLIEKYLSADEAFDLPTQTDIEELKNYRFQMFDQNIEEEQISAFMIRKDKLQEGMMLHNIGVTSSDREAYQNMVESERDNFILSIFKRKTPDVLSKYCKCIQTISLYLDTIDKIETKLRQNSYMRKYASSYFTENDQQIIKLLGVEIE